MRERVRPRHSRTTPCPGSLCHATPSTGRLLRRTILPRLLVASLLPMLAAPLRAGALRRVRRALVPSISTAVPPLEPQYRPAPLQAIGDDAAAGDSPVTGATDGHEADRLLREIRRLTGNPNFNVNSPKQVSAAVFGGGNQSSTSRQVLRLAADGAIGALSPRQRRLAGLVQQYRALGTTTTLTRSRSRKPTGGSVATTGQGFSTGAAEADADLDSTATAAELPLQTTAAADDIVLDDSEDSIVFGVDDEPRVATAGAELSPYERQVHDLFDQPRSRLDPYWREPLLRLTRAPARALVAQLDPLQCPMGFDPLATPSSSVGRSSDFGRDPDTDDNGDEAPRAAAKTTTAGKKGSFLAYCREQKEAYPDAIILTRCGDFYETYGLDAALLVEHCGLNAMAGKAKAGCPIRNIQATLDGLTARGFRVAVYEEAADTDAGRGAAASGGAKSRIKSRFLAQIVSPASPTYLYDLILLNNLDVLESSPPSRPYVGILSLDAGYTFVEISAEERSVRVTERLTAEAVACRLAAYPPADPLIYVPSMAEYQSRQSFLLPFLPSQSRSDLADGGPGARLRTHVIPPTLVQEASPAINDAHRAKNIIVSSILRMIEADDVDGVDRRVVTTDDFILVNPLATGTNPDVTFTQSLHKETATQLGLMDDKSIPSLVSFLVPDAAPASTRRFLRRYLLTPPPPSVADAMRDLVSYFKVNGPSVPPLSVPPIGKVLSLLRSGQASAEIYRELAQTLDTTESLIDSLYAAGNDKVLQSMMTLMEYESGLAAEPDSVRKRCFDARQSIEEIIVYGRSPLVADLNDDPMMLSHDPAVPPAFFERNELPWRDRVRYDTMPEAYEKVQGAARHLADAIRQDFCPDDSSVLQDIFNNLLVLREIPKGVKDKNKYIHPHDRFGKSIRNRFTTENVQEALSNYVNACEKAKCQVSDVLMELSEQLHDKGHMPAIVQASHMNLLVSVAFHHSARANILGWNAANTCEFRLSESAGRFVNLWPYWMDREEAVPNTFDLNGMWILTAPNMSGKSTILRSTAAASLLISCGLCAPVEDGTLIRRFDHIFVRGASSDVPTENKSAFGAEMGDVAALLQSCGERSLVFVDELARGTSPRDGAILAAAVLEDMATKGMSGVFATHLHDILDLPLRSADRIVRKKMDIKTEHVEHETRYKWTFHLVDGICTDSLALETAKRFGVPQTVLERAEAFRKYLAESSGISSDIANSESGSYSTTRTDNNSIAKGMPESVFQLVESKIKEKINRIPPNWIPPASLEGTSCVYVLSLLVDREKGSRRYYIGETDNLQQRIQEHRAKGAYWSTAEAIAIPVRSGKTEARSLESLLIRTLAQAGVDLISTSDGRTIRHRNKVN